MTRRGGRRTDREDWREVLDDRLQIFTDHWRGYAGTEQAGAQSFLQQLLDIYAVSYRPGTIFEQHPVRIPVRNAGQGSLFSNEAASFTTERMDMYLPRVCVWEMKSPSERDLAKHHGQLLGYWSRMRPRYMVLCNFHEFWIYDTKDEDGQLEPKLRLPLSELPARSEALLFLRGEQPDLEARAERITSDAARRLGRLVRDMIEASAEPDRDRDRIAKLILQCVFAMFAEDTELIPAGMFTNVLKDAGSLARPDPIFALFDDLGTRAMDDKAHRFAPYVNGPLFDRGRSGLGLDAEQIGYLYAVARDFDWQDVHPEIFGSIFEQALDPVQRHELGAHFTRESDIARVVQPTIVEPWRQRVEQLRHPKEAEALIEAMKAFHILDPACGCGNFLYVAFREMKRIEAALRTKWTVLQHKVAKRRADIKPPPPGPWFTVQQLHGIEIEGFAAFLARVVLWIGDHLANRELGLDESAIPLKSLESNILHQDALTTDWVRPEGELAIVGNPPYLGVRKLRRELGDAYVDELFARFPKNRAADFVTYWFTQALKTLRPGERAGFVCTNSVAQNESREASIDALVARGGTITDAWKSYPWPGEAAVHIGIVNWVMGPYEGIKTLDGREVDTIAPSLTTDSDVTTARAIAANEDLCFMGVTPGNNGFVLDQEQRDAILSEDPTSSAVVRPYLIGKDVNREINQRPSRWIVDFGIMSKDEAEKFPGAMRHVRREVYPTQSKNRREAYARHWWRFSEARPGLRRATSAHRNVLVIPRVSPRLIVARQSNSNCFDCQLMVVALEGWYHFGILQSAIHSAWARARGSTLEERLRYTNTTIFETFPFPRQPDGRYAPRELPASEAAARLAQAAEHFDAQRRAACRQYKLGLTKIHNLLEEHRLPDLEAAWDAMNDAANACYDWPPDTWRNKPEVLRRLLEMNQVLAAEQG